MVRIKGRTSEEYHKEDSPNAHPQRKHVLSVTLVTKKGGCDIDFVTLSPLIITSLRYSDKSDIIIYLYAGWHAFYGFQPSSWQHPIHEGR